MHFISSEKNSFLINIHNECFIIALKPRRKGMSDLAAYGYVNKLATTYATLLHHRFITPCLTRKTIKQCSTGIKKNL